MAAPVEPVAERLVAASETPVASMGTSRRAGRNRCESWAPMPGPTRIPASPLKRLRRAAQPLAEQELARRAWMQPAGSWTAVSAEPVGLSPAGPERRVAWAASPRPRCEACRRSRRDLRSVAWDWRSVREPRPVASAVPLVAEPRPAALAWLSSAQRRTNRSSSESSSAQAGPRPDSRTEARRASCARSVVPAARCRSLREPSPARVLHRLAWRPARPRPNPLPGRPPAMTAARASGWPAPARRADQREPRRERLGRS
jgi:hypothetical protein